MDDILQRVREGPIKLVLEMYGFRRDRNRWACHVHDDKRPSCTISHNRLRCWVCDKTWSNLDLVMDRDGVGVVEASKRLAELYGMPSSTMSDVERKAYAAEREARAATARKAEWFRRGMRILVDRRLRDAGTVAAVHVWRWHRRAHVVRSGTDEDVLKCWSMTPADRIKVESLGRNSSIEAEKLTRRLVEVLCAVQEGEALRDGEPPCDGAAAKDPMEFVQRHGAQAYIRSITGARDCLDWVLHRAANKFDARTHDGRRDAFKFILPYMRVGRLMKE